jgi:hypothetical protein
MSQFVSMVFIVSGRCFVINQENLFPTFAGFSLPVYMKNYRAIFGSTCAVRCACLDVIFIFIYFHSHPPLSLTPLHFGSFFFALIHRTTKGLFDDHSALRGIPKKPSDGEESLRRLSKAPARRFFFFSSSILFLHIFSFITQFYCSNMWPWSALRSSL